MIKHIPKKDLITTNWSGGTTTQLYIYPENSSYAERNFLFRISTATVDVAESVFTSLPGIHRILMILDGTLHIQHINQYEKTLKQFETDAFPGEWTTQGKGKVRDFNLMMRGDVRGKLESVKFTCEKGFRFTSEHVLLYVHSGKIISGNMEIETGDVLLLHNETQLNLSTNGDAVIILTHIQPNTF